LQAQKLGVAERVEIRSVPSDDRATMAELLAEASVVTLLSEYESQGIAAIEALSLKRSLLVLDNSALVELAEAGLAHAVSPDTGPQQVAAEILRLIDEPLRPSSVELPTWDDCAGRLLEVYASVLGSRQCVS
jgi:glycosyltransferase involved in cell wall biosynthesis